MQIAGLSDLSNQGWAKLDKISISSASNGALNSKYHMLLHVQKFPMCYVLIIN